MNKPCACLLRRTGCFGLAWCPFGNSILPIKNKIGGIGSGTASVERLCLQKTDKQRDSQSSGNVKEEMGKRKM